MRNNWQQDPKWAYNTIGTSTSLFKDFACLICSIGDLCDKTPVEVNDYLNSVNGYADGDLVIWSKLSGLLKNEQKFPCIASVDEDYSHFVVALDKDNILDPYYGDQIKVTSRYKGLKTFYPWTTKGDYMDKDQCIGLMKETFRQAWVKLHQRDDYDPKSIDAEAIQAVNEYEKSNNGVYAQNKITQWAKEGVEKMLKEKDKLINDLRDENDKKDISISQLEKTLSDANKAQAELSAKDAEEIAQLKGRLMTCEENCAKIPTIVKTEYQSFWDWISKLFTKNK